MSQPTTGVYFNSTDPPAPEGNQNTVPQSDGGTPQQSITTYPQAATPALLGVVRPDNKSTFVGSDGTIFTIPGEGGLTNPLTGEIDIDCPNPQTRALVIRGSESAPTNALVQSAYGEQAVTSPLAVAFANPNTAGNAIIALGIGYNGAASNGVTDSNGNTYVNVYSDGSEYSIWLAVDIAAGPNTVTFTSGGGGYILNLVILERSDIPPTNSFDGGASNTVSSGPNAIGPLTTSSNLDLILVIGKDAASGESSLSVASGAPVVASFSSNDSNAIAVWGQTVTPSGSYGDTVSTTANDQLICCILAFKVIPNSTQQIADLLDYENAAGEVIGGVNGQAQLELPVTAGMPTNTPIAGTIAYVSGVGVVEYNGSAWVAVGSAGGTFPAWVEETPSGVIDGVNVTFTLSYTPLAGSLRLDVNGVKQGLTKTPPDFTLVGNTITFTYPPSPGTGSPLEDPDWIVAQYQH